MQRGRGKFGRNNDRTTNGRRKNKAFNGRNNRGRDKKIIPCYTCGKYGHYANQFTQNSNEEKVLKLIEKEKNDNNINNNNSKNITENNITKNKDYIHNVISFHDLQVFLCKQIFYLTLIILHGSGYSVLKSFVLQ